MSLPEPPTSNRSPDSSVSGVIFALAALMAFGNFLFLPILSGGSGPEPALIILIAVWMGALTGQFGLVAIWGVLAPQKLLLRLGVSLALGAFWTVSFVLGIGVASLQNGPPPPDAIPGVLGGMLLLPLIVASAQVPLWIARLFWGWQVGHPRQLDKLSRPKQFSLANLMVATGLISCLLALNQPAGWLLQIPPQELWLYAGVYSLTAMVLSLLATPPAVYALLRHGSMGRGFGGMMLYAFVFASGTCGVLAIFAHGMPAEAVVAIFGYITGLALTVTVPLLVLRNYGFRLVIGDPSPEQVVRFFEGNSGKSDYPR